MGNSRIPEVIHEFNSYINSTDDYLQAGTPTTNRERLTISAAAGTEWSARRVYWRDTLYKKYSDPLQSTSAVKDEVRIFMKDFHTFGNPLLNVMVAASAANSNDEKIFNFKIGHHEPTVRETPIKEQVAMEGKPLTGGEVEFTCRPAHDSKHPSKHPESDSIQLAYLIKEEGATPPPPVPGQGAGADSLPDPDSDAMVKELFTKASFIKNFGVANKNKLVIVYLLGITLSILS